MKKYAIQFPVALMSKTLGVSNSGYYKWLKNQSSKAALKDDLDKEIRSAFEKSLNTYGSPRIAKALEKRGISCSKNTVARRMQNLNIVARRKRKYVTTTDSNHNYKIAENLLNRNFEVSKLNTVWVSDITYVRVDTDWMYLTTFIDLADRMVVGWSLSNNMTAEDTVNSAFRNAVLKRKICNKSKLMVHSDRGVQYACNGFRNLLSQYGCIQSMSRKGNCWDNAVAESFFKTIKTEALNHREFKNENQLQNTIFRYIYGFYNTIRIHTSLGGLSPWEIFKLKSSKLTA